MGKFAALSSRKRPNPEASVVVLSKRGLHLTQEHSTGCAFVRRFVGKSVGRCAWPAPQADKRHPPELRRAAVEAERVFSKIVFKMLSTERSLVRAQQPALEQGGNAINSRHADVGLIAAIQKHRPIVAVAALQQLAVTTPAIGQNLGAFYSDIANEWHQAGAGHVRDVTHTHSPHLFDWSQTTSRQTRFSTRCASARTRSPPSPRLPHRRCGSGASPGRSIPALVSVRSPISPCTAPCGHLLPV